MASSRREEKINWEIWHPLVDSKSWVKWRENPGVFENEWEEWTNAWTPGDCRLFDRYAVELPQENEKCWAFKDSKNCQENKNCYWDYNDKHCRVNWQTRQRILEPSALSLGQERFRNSTTALQTALLFGQYRDRPLARPKKCVPELLAGYHTRKIWGGQAL